MRVSRRFARRTGRAWIRGKAAYRRDEGLWLGLLGVLCFSVTLPASRVAVPELGGAFVGLGRALIAASLAAVLLLVRREPLPERRHWFSLVMVGLGVVVGFPLFSAMAMKDLPASHAAVLIGLMPAATAMMAVLRTGERPSLAFWLSCAAGVAAVLVFAVAQGAGSLHPGDLLLLLAIVLGAMGYADGGRLSREIEGWRVICWALVLAAPFLVVPVGFTLRRELLLASPQAWLGFAYVSCVSMFLAFFAWYRALALGGVARIGQVQLVQPVLTLAIAVFFLGERVTAATVGAALLVIVTAALSQRTRTPRSGTQALGSS